MKVLSIFPKISQNYQPCQVDTQKKDVSISDYPKMEFYPKNYVPYFGARLNRTPENFYGQSFNMEKMPQTMKNYLMEDFDVRCHMTPMQIQKKAFEYVGISENIGDVKSIYPNEPLFDDLKTLDTIRPKSGYLLTLRSKGAKNNDVLKTEEDLTVYLLKKIYLEGKDLKEINEDFNSDVKDEYKTPMREEDGKPVYFIYSTLKSLGVHFPEKSYWKSLQATRQDKEYIPWSRKPSAAPSNPREITEEERANRSNRMIEWWLSLDASKRAEHIEKMKAGKLESDSDSVFVQYQSPIMIFAAEQIGLSDKLSEFLTAKYNNKNDYLIDYSELDDRMSAYMQEFWDSKPELKREFSDAIKKTIELVEFAVSNDDKELLDKFLSITAMIKERNIEKAKQRKLDVPSEIDKMQVLKECFEAEINRQSAYFPDNFRQAYIEHCLSYKDMNSLLFAFEKAITTGNTKSFDSILTSIFTDFEKKNKRDVISANVAIAQFLYSLINDSTIFTGDIGNIMRLVNDNKLNSQMMTYKSLIEIMMSKYTQGFDDRELKNISGFFITKVMPDIARVGYRTLDNPVVRKRTDNLHKVVKGLNKNKDNRKKFINFLKDYEGQLKYALNILTPKALSLYLIESIVDDYLIFLEDAKNGRK